MSIIGVDPGKKSPAHCILSPLAFSKVPFTDRNVTVFVEGQFVNRGVSRQSLMTLSFCAGMAAGSYLQQGCRVYVTPPKKWKPMHLGPGSDRIDKQVYQNKCRLKGLIPDEVWQLGPDEIDAYLIAKAGEKMLSSKTRLKELKWWIG